MANGDIIDTMFGWIFELFGWILGGIVKLIVAMVTGLFGLTVGLFKKDKRHHCVSFVFSLL